MIHLILLMTSFKSFCILLQSIALNCFVLYCIEKKLTECQIAILYDNIHNVYFNCFILIFDHFLHIFILNVDLTNH